MDYTYDTRMGYSEIAYIKAKFTGRVMVILGLSAMAFGVLYLPVFGLGVLLMIPGFLLAKKGWKRLQVCRFVYRAAHVTDPNVTEHNLMEYLGYTQEQGEEYALMAIKLKLV